MKQRLAGSWLSCRSTVAMNVWTHLPSPLRGDEHDSQEGSTPPKDGVRDSPGVRRLRAIVGFDSRPSI